MGRLGNLKYRDLAAKLRERGFRFDRQAKGSHEIWLHPITC
ncbi:MAG: type II toxin-antitoxin system HicA family toxin [Verrucomicrobiae bacterium]|nr:type II toxin-antitoxin system HicA family toxin [Verrucomicrobiae bacterium]